MIIVFTVNYSLNFDSAISYSHSEFNKHTKGIDLKYIKVL